MTAVPDARIGETVLLPEYVVEIAELLADTEGSKDATVRAVRKIVVQGAVALRALTKTSSPDTDGADQIPAPQAPVPAPSGLEPAPKRKSGEGVRLLRENGITAAQVRLWARHVGHAVPDRGTLTAEVVQAYLAEHPKEA